MIVRILAAASLFAAMSISPSQAATLQTLWDFSCVAGDGCFPTSSALMPDGTGGFLGATTHGGANWGTLFQLHKPRGNWKEKILKDFELNRPRQGLIPSNLIPGPFGALYGATAGGGKFGEGTIFQLLPPAEGERRWTENVIYDFCVQHACRDGSTPLAGLVADPSGQLLGVTQYGGPNDGGVLFALAPPESIGDRWTFTQVHSFCRNAGCGADGYLPAGRLAGTNLFGIFGTTRNGGKYDAGIAYMFWGEIGFRRLYNFCSRRDCRDGKEPTGTLLHVQGPNPSSFGTLFGTTISGGRFNRGVLFKLEQNPVDPYGPWVETVLYNFCSKPGCTDGQTPAAGLIADPDAVIPTLYGTTAAGGEFGKGTVFMLRQDGVNQTWTHTVLYSFCRLLQCRDGEAPAAELTLHNGNLYGTTLAGGFYKWGTAFELTLP